MVACLVEVGMSQNVAVMLLIYTQHNTTTDFYL